MSAAILRVICLFMFATLGACGSKEPSDGPAAEKEYFVQIHSDASIGQLCASAMKVTSIYTVEGNNPEKFNEWNGTKDAACRAAENRAELELEQESEQGRTEAMLRANEETAATMALER